MAAVVTGSFVVAAVGAFYTLRGLHPTQARLYLRGGTFAGFDRVAPCCVSDRRPAGQDGWPSPTRDACRHGRQIRRADMAGVAVIGQPNVERGVSIIPSRCPARSASSPTALSEAYVHGLDEYPEDAWPDNIELLYYSFHLMITLGTIFILLMGFARFRIGAAGSNPAAWLLWVLMLAFPFPYIANTLGWMTAELGRQPWLIYGLFHTRDGYSKVVSNGDTIFTLIGFTGLYFVLGLLFLFLVGREIGHGPDKEAFAIAAGRNAGRRLDEVSVASGGNSGSNNGAVAAGLKGRSI